MFGKKFLIITLLVAAVFIGIAALTSVDSNKSWHNFREISRITQATLLPTGDLPFRLLRSPSFHNATYDDQYASSKRIKLDEFFGFELRTMPDRDRFTLNLDDREFSVQLRSVEKKGDHYFTWIGTVEGNANHVLILTYLNGYVGANISSPAGIYAIHYEQGRHYLRKFDSPQ